MVVVTSYLVQWGFVLDFGRVKAMQYSSYIQNLIMSVMFLAMLEKRQSSKGQSMLLAVAKWIGTLAPLGIVSMNYGTSEFQPLIIILGIFCSVYDLMYIYLLGKRIKADLVKNMGMILRDILCSVRPSDKLNFAFCLTS